MPADQDLERIYDQHGQALFAFLLSLLRNEADTRDVLQSVFVKLGQRPEILHGIHEPRAFLLRLARNAAIDLTRRRGVRERQHEQFGQAEAVLFAPAGEPDAQTFRTQLERSLTALPDEQRTVVYLKLWEQLTFEQIAQALEIPLNTAASRYRYGLDKLRQQLRPLYEEIK